VRPDDAPEVEASAVVDLADGAPPVCCELGVALAIGRPIPLLTDEDATLP
jgi:hypothetical protein